MLNDDADLFYDLEVAFEGRPLEARRPAIPGVEEPDFGHADDDAPARMVALSPVAVGERAPYGHGPFLVALEPSREGAAGRLVVTVRLAAGPDAVHRWEQKMRGLAPVTRPGLRLPGRARVGAFLAPEPDTAVLVTASLATNASLFGIPGMVPLHLGGEARFTFLLPAGTGPDLLIVGDGLEVLFVAP